MMLTEQENRDHRRYRLYRLSLLGIILCLGRQRIARNRKGTTDTENFLGERPFLGVVQLVAAVAGALDLGEDPVYQIGTIAR